MMKTCRSTWRKLVKKLRRKKKRQQQAKERAAVSVESGDVSDPSEERQTESDETERMLRNELWMQEEERAQKSWQEKKLALEAKDLENKLVQERIRKEWEAAREQKLEKKKAEEFRLAELQGKIESYINIGGDIPQELLTLKESNPGRDPCPFFSKVAACRFGPACSRNHTTPGISNTILLPNCYSHFTLTQNRSSEYDTDVNLEFDEREMNHDFREFFEDFVPELEQYGILRILVVCKNNENHLRGNLYAEYSHEREALKAARILNARWYGGRQLSVNFVRVRDWSAAVCGDFYRKRCPKGDRCNFLHIFRNPQGRLMPEKRYEKKQDSVRSWRWSESPERTKGGSRRESREHDRTERVQSKTPKLSERRKRSRSRSREKHSTPRNERKISRSRSRSRQRKSRSRSKERHYEARRLRDKSNTPRMNEEKTAGYSKRKRSRSRNSSRRKSRSRSK